MKKPIIFLATIAALVTIASCEKPQPPQEEVGDPELTVESSVSIAGAAGEYTIPYSITNPVEGMSLTATAATDWIFDMKATSADVAFSVSNNLGARRSADVELKYGDKCSSTVKVIQNTFEFESFSVSVGEITTSSAKVTIKPKKHQSNYFFEVLSKSMVDKFTAKDIHSVGDKEYAEDLYQDDLAYLKEQASKGGHALSDHLLMSSAMYKVTSRGESTEMPYSSLHQETDYYVVVYGMDFDGTRTTEVCLYQFTTNSPKYSDLTFTGQVTNVTQTSARITITPSNNSEYYFWTYVNETDYAKYDADQIVTNTVANLRETVTYYGVTFADVLNKGQDIYDATDEFSMGTQYTIFAWGMDTDGNVTTKPQELFQFRTKANDITDDCKFDVQVVEVESMDVRLKVNPSNPSTRYYIGVINEKRCVGYSDYQMVQRILNMESSRLENGEYGDGVTWSNHPDLWSGEQTKWARRDLRWTFEPETSFRIYVFGIDSKGLCSTEIYRSDVTTAAAEPSSMTFQVSLSSAASWHYGAFDIVPSNEEDYYMPYLMPTSELDLYRYADGSLMERELMDKIRDVYEDEISQYVYRGSRTGEKMFYNVWTSDDDYSLVLFGYAGSNTTPMYEFKFHSPAIPFGKADSDLSYTYEIFNGDDLYAMAPNVWEGAQGECVMKINIKVTGNPENYYFGVWPPKENYASTGGIDHLVLLAQNTLTTGDNIINKTFGVLKPWWDGPGTSGSGEFVTDEGEHLRCMPWSITAYTEDANYNFGPLHYEVFIPVQKPEDQVKGLHEIGYRTPYDFWSSKTSSEDTKTLIFNVPKPETL